MPKSDNQKLKIFYILDYLQKNSHQEHPVRAAELLSMLENEELDAVSVCTYNRTHAECSIYALKKGVHVLLEKPMCVTLEEAVEIRKAEKSFGGI